MMDDKIRFKKYQGAGNDFVMLDNRNGEYDHIHPELISALCNRRFGIGADGILLLSRADEGKSDTLFRMEYYNSDGSRASFCGNGARCLCAFAHEVGAAPADVEFGFVADDGHHRATYSHDVVDLQMIDVAQTTETEGGLLLNTGVPHFVKMVDDVEAVDIMSVAPALRHCPSFGPEGANVNFVTLTPDGIRVRTYERGVEGETLACGTGIVASAIAAHRKTGMTTIEVEARGGHLRVRLTPMGNGYTDIHLIGGAEKVFEGEV